MALRAEAQVFGWIGEPGIWTQSSEFLLKDSYPAAGRQGNPGPKLPDDSHFAGLRAATVTGTPGSGRPDMAALGEPLYPAQVNLVLLNTLKLSGTTQLI